MYNRIMKRRKLAQPDNKPPIDSAPGPSSHHRSLFSLIPAQLRQYKMSSAIVQTWLDADNSASSTPTQSPTSSALDLPSTSGEARPRGCKRKASDVGLRDTFMAQSHCTNTPAKRRFKINMGVREASQLQASHHPGPSMELDLPPPASPLVPPAPKPGRFAAVAKTMFVPACSLLSRGRKRTSSEMDDTLELRGLIKRMKVEAY